MRFPKPAKRSPKPPKRIARKVRPRRERKSTLAALKRRLWMLLRGYVRDTWGDTCFTCGAQGLAGSNWQTAHFVNAGKSAAVRYDPDNLRPCCYRCNVGLRGNLAEFAIRLLDQIGEPKFRRLLARSRVVKQWTRPEVEALIAALERGGAEYELLWAEMAA